MKEIKNINAIGLYVKSKFKCPYCDKLQTQNVGFGGTEVCFLEDILICKFCKKQIKYSENNEVY